MSLARKRLLGLLSGAWVAQAVYAVVKLGVPDMLPDTASRLAAATGASEQALTRLLRALCTAGLCTEAQPGRFDLTAGGRLLRSDVEDSVRLHALLQGDEVFRSFAEIMHTVMGNGPAFEKVYGRPFYVYLEEHPAAAEVFNTSMGETNLPSTVDLSWARSIVDVGGGDGSLLLRLLRDGQTGVLVELPSAIAAARVKLEPLGERVEFVEGSFFDGVPEGRDVYILSRVLHNWSDDNAGRILRLVRAAMPAHGRLVVLEAFAGGGLVDLLMLVTLEGRDRTVAEYRELLTANGFAVVQAGEGSLVCAPVS
ncbi:methyltransferase [Allorhizocola rhizosphaerae]|uniref:methyltransferase n=1 Tax=Allorhizocola rhizosphaerae TaxID=1872709 RepID=UPI0013C37271|nr:methyltransferase [Allorhizocola rhizosphaerae]